MKHTFLFKKQIFLVLAAFVSIFSSSECRAQNDLKLQSSFIQLAYKNPAYLSFDVKYTFADENSPGVTIDSTMGTFKISGTNYWGLIDSTEYMQNNSYSTVLYKPEKLMQISNPTTVYPQMANFSMFDSLVGKNNYSVTWSNIGINKSMSLTFSNPASFPFKNFKITYDSVTYFVKQVQYTIRDDYNDYGNSYNMSSTGNTSPYVIIKADYTNYQTTVFSSTIFNSGNYFLVSAGNYTPQPPFSDYQVFVASSNLTK